MRRPQRHNGPSFWLVAQDSVPNIIVNGCYASAKLLAIDDYVRYGVGSNNLNEKSEILLTTTLTISETVINQFLCTEETIDTNTYHITKYPCNNLIFYFHIRHFINLPLKYSLINHLIQYHFVYSLHLLILYTNNNQYLRESNNHVFLHLS